MGLGLIGGSLALALKGFEGYEIVGVDVSQPTLRFAAEHGVGDRVTEDAAAVLPGADVVALALHPRGSSAFWTEYRARFKQGCPGHRRVRREERCHGGGRGAARGSGLHRLPPHGGHRVLGHRARLCRDVPGSHLLLTPRESSTPEHVALMERLAAYIGCRDVYKTTPEEHDAMIAYTSQVMHIIAVSVCDDPMLFACRGFEGSSFRGCTRVAALDVGLWTELFSLNRPALLTVLDRLMENLGAYREALASGTAESPGRKAGLLRRPEAGDGPARARSAGMTKRRRCNAAAPFCHGF